MLIVGERINTFKKSVMRAYEEKDSGVIRQEAVRQAEAGAHVIDINAGSDIDVEPDNMKWAVQIVQEFLEALDISLKLLGLEIRVDTRQIPMGQSPRFTFCHQLASSSPIQKLLSYPQQVMHMFNDLIKAN